MSDNIVPSVTIVLARMESARLPGKALVDLNGIPLIAMILERLSLLPELQPVILATTDDPKDNLLAREAVSRGVSVYRGSGKDVLRRLIAAALAHGVKPEGSVVKATGDNPFVDIDEAVRALAEHKRTGSDLTLVDGLPMGAGVGVFKLDALGRSWQQSDDPVSREHPGLLMHANHDSYKIQTIDALPEKRWPELRLTVDEHKDLELARHIVSRLDSCPAGPPLLSIIEMLREDPGLISVNRDVVQITPIMPDESTIDE